MVLVLSELEWEIEAELITGCVLETPCKLELEIEVGEMSTLPHSRHAYNPLQYVKLFLDFHLSHLSV